MPSRRPEWIPKRKAFPKAVKAAVLKRSGNFCEMEGCVNIGRDFDHRKPVAFGGESTLENCRLLCRDCNAALGAETATQAALADRKGGRSGQQARRKRKIQDGRYRGIQSRGFDKTRTKKMNGKVVDRRKTDLSRDT